MEQPPAGDEQDPHAAPRSAVPGRREWPDLPASRSGRLSDADLLDAVAEVEASVARLHARQVELLAEFSRRGADVREYAADELAARLAWTAFTAQRRLDDAEALTDRLPRTLELLDAGLLDLPRARTVVTGTLELDDACAAAVDAAIASDAPELSTRALARRVALEALAVDPAAAENRAKTARRGRRVTARPLGDGCARLVADGPAEDIATLLTGLTRACRTAAPGDDRGIDARRFDTLTAFGQHLLDGGTRPADTDGRDGSGSPGGLVAAAPSGGPGVHSGASAPESTATGTSRPGRVRPAVLVTMTLPALLGLREDPAQLDGYGPLPASVARQIAENARLRRLLTDPFTGIAIGLDGHDHPGFRLDTDRGDPDDEPGAGPGPDPGSGPDQPPPGQPPPPPTSGARRPPPAPPTTPPRSGPGARALPATQVRPEPQRCPVAAAGGGGYRPRPLLDKLIRLRDQTCRMPGCARPAQAADVDHAVAHPAGPTCPCNLQALCRRHHQMKQAPGTSVERHGNATWTWRLPTGHTYASTPAPALAAAAVAPVTAGGRGLPGGKDVQTDPQTFRQPYPPDDSAARDLERLRRPAPPDYGPPPF